MVGDCVSLSLHSNWYPIANIVHILNGALWDADKFFSLMSCQLLEASSEQSLKRRPTQEFLRPYIAAKMDALPDTFPLGDEKKYNGFYNKPLPGQQQYLCFVLAALKDHESVSETTTSPYL